MSTIQEQAIFGYGSFSIVSLPYGYQTYAGAKYFVEKVLSLGSVSDIKIYHTKNQNGREITTALIDLFYWFNNEFSVRIQKQLIDVIDLGEDVENTSIHILSDDIGRWNGESLLITFNNGEPMTHISIRNAKTSDHRSSYVSLDGVEPLFYADQAPEMWSSIYIPVIMPSIHFDGKPLGDSSMLSILEANLKIIFEEKLCVGRVSRVDFLESPGFNSSCNIARTTLKAFVHFTWWANTPTTIKLRHAIEHNGQWRMDGIPNAAGGIDRFTGGTSRLNPFLIFKINHKPIPASTDALNVHQLSAILKEKSNQIQFLLSTTTDLLERLTQEGCVSCDETELLESKLKEIVDSNSKCK